MVNPEAYAVDALKSVLFKNAGFLLSPGPPLSRVFTTVMMTLAIVSFRRTV